MPNSFVRLIGSAMMFFSAVATAQVRDSGAYAGLRVGSELSYRDWASVEGDGDMRGLYAGWNFGRHWAVEASYSDLGSTYSVDDGPDQGFGVDGKSWTIGAVFRVPVSERFDLFAGAGLFRLDQDGVVITIGGPYPSDYSETSIYSELGARFHFNTMLALRGSLQWVDADEYYLDTGDARPWLGLEISF